MNFISKKLKVFIIVISVLFLVGVCAVVFKIFYESGKYEMGELPNMPDVFSKSQSQSSSTTADSKPISEPTPSSTETPTSELDDIPVINVPNQDNSEVTSEPVSSEPVSEPTSEPVSEPASQPVSAPIIP